MKTTVTYEEIDLKELVRQDVLKRHPGHTVQVEVEVFDANGGRSENRVRIIADLSTPATTSQFDR